MMMQRFTPEELRAWLPFVIATLHLFATLDADLKEACDLSHLDYGILTLLSGAPGGQHRMSDLAATFGVDPSVVTYRVGRMEARGLVERAPCASDGRVVLARIAAAGRELLAAALPVHVAGARRHFLAHIEPDELEVIGRVFGRILAEQRPPTLHLSGPSPGDDLP